MQLNTKATAQLTAVCRRSVTMFGEVLTKHGRVGVYIISLVLGMYSYCVAMHPTQSSLLPFLPDEMFTQVGQWLPIKTVAAWGCADKYSYALFDTPHWIKQRAAHRYTLPKHRAKQYCEINNRIWQVCMYSTPAGYNQAEFNKLFKNPYADANYITYYGVFSQRFDALVMQASRNLCVPLIQALVQKRADINCITQESYAECSVISEVITSSFCRCKKTYNLDAQKRTLDCLVKLGADIHHIRSDGSNYLFYAFGFAESQVSNAMELVPHLLSYGINPNYQRPGTGQTPLWVMACDHRSSPVNTKALIALLDAGGDDPHLRPWVFGLSAYDYVKHDPEWRAIMERYNKKPRALCPSCTLL